MFTFFKSITALIVAMSLQLGMLGATEVPAAQVAEECMSGIATQSEQAMTLYGANTYVNFIENLQGDEDTVQRMRDALFQNFSYKIDGLEEREDLAVARVTIEQCDFSGVLKKYEKKSYKYITEHLYDEDTVDKEKLSAKCLDIYVSQIEKVAKAGKTHEEVIYLPLVSNGHNGWNAVLEDETMKTILGDIAIPENEQL